MDSVLVGFGLKAAHTGVTYGAKAAAGHWGYDVLSSVVNKSIETFGNLIGGKVIGPMLAGGAVDKVATSVNAVADALEVIGQTVIDCAAPEKKKTISVEKFEKMISADGSEVETANVISEAKVKKKSSEKVNWADAATKILKAGSILVGAAGVMGLGAAAPIVMAVADVAPKLAKVLNDPTAQKEVDIVDDIVKNIAVNLFATLSGTLASNMTKYATVKDAYDGSIQYGESIAAGVNKFLPKSIHETTKKIGSFVGWVDAGKVAMSAETIAKANQAGDSAGTLVSKGIKIINSVVDVMCESSGNDDSIFEMARKGAWVATGILAGTALTVVAPQAAALVGMTAVVGVSDKIAAYALQKLAPKQPAKVEGDASNTAKVEAETKVEEKKVETSVTLEDSFLEDSLSLETVAAAAA